MKNLIIPAVGLALLAGCANQDQTTARSPSTGATQTPSNFQSIGACEPTAWVSLDRDSRNLPAAQRQRVQMLLEDAQSLHADDNRGQCLYTLQQAERIVREGQASTSGRT